MTDARDRLPEAQRPRAGTTALVSGGNSGIGLETVRQLLGYGVSVWMGSRDLARGRAAAAAAAAAESLDGDIRVVQLDVTDPDSIARAADEVGDLDILVNNAGINPGRGDIEGTSVDQLRRAYETNVFGLVAVTQAFLPALRRSEHPRIVNLGSGTGSLTWSSGPNPQFDWERSKGGGIAYRSSKTAVDAITLLTAQALGDGVKVNALAPGLRVTNLLPGLTVGGDPAEGAAGAVRLALLPDDGPSGALWSWDGTRAPW